MFSQMRFRAMADGSSMRPGILATQKSQETRHWPEPSSAALNRAASESVTRIGHQDIRIGNQESDTSIAESVTEFPGSDTRIVGSDTRIGHRESVAKRIKTCSSIPTIPNQPESVTKQIKECSSIPTIPNQPESVTKQIKKCYRV